MILLAKAVSAEPGETSVVCGRLPPFSVPYSIIRKKRVAHHWGCATQYFKSELNKFAEPIVNFNSKKR